MMVPVLVLSLDEVYKFSDHGLVGLGSLGRSAHDTGILPWPQEWDKGRARQESLLPALLEHIPATQLRKPCTPLHVRVQEWQTKTLTKTAWKR